MLAEEPPFRPAGRAGGILLPESGWLAAESDGQPGRALPPTGFRPVVADGKGWKTDSPV